MSTFLYCDECNATNDTRSKSKNARIYFISYLGPWIFDYRADINDRIALYIQLAALSISIIGAVASIYDLNAKNVSKELNIISVCLIFYVIEAISVGFYNEQNLFTMLTLALPTLLFVVSLRVVPPMLTAYRGVDIFVRDFIFISVCCAVFKILFVFAISKTPIENIRFEILSGGVIVTSAYLISRLFVENYLRDLFVFGAHSTAVALSVTRTQILIIIGIFVSVIFININMFLRKSVVNKIFLLICAGVVVIGLTSVANGDLTIRWLERMFSSQAEFGIDITGATRAAEIEFQMGAFMESPQAILIGHGIAGRNRLVGDYYDIVVEIIGKYDLEDVGFGHNIYTSILFQSGLIVGSLVILSLATLFLISLNEIRNTNVKRLRQKIDELGFWAALSIIGVTIYGFVGGTFGDRGLTLFFGISVAILGWVRSERRRARH